LQNGTKVALNAITTIDGWLSGRLRPVKFSAILTVG